MLTNITILTQSYFTVNNLFTFLLVLNDKNTYLKAKFPLICFQWLFLLNLATQRLPLVR